MSSVFLRSFEPDDYILINKWRNDPEIHRLTVGIYRSVSSEMEKEWVREKIMNNYHEIYWAICLNNDERRMVGYTSLRNINYINRVAEGGGIIIGEKDFRDGIIMLEATLIKLEYAFDALNINRITSGCLISHKISSCALQALRFVFEGQFRQAVYKNGQYYDFLFFSLLRDEYYNYLKNGDYEMKNIIRRFNQVSRGEISLPVVT